MTARDVGHNSEDVSQIIPIDLFLDIALDGVILYDTDDYMAERLAYLRHLIQTQGLRREQRGDELLWRWEEFPGFDWSLEWETTS